MKFSVALFSILLLVTATLASPQLEMQNTTSWGGLVYSNPPSGDFANITGTFTVPVVSIPSGAASDILYQSFFWVGIADPVPLLQTGIFAQINPNGVPS